MSTSAAFDPARNRKLAHRCCETLIDRNEAIRRRVGRALLTNPLRRWHRRRRDVRAAVESVDDRAPGLRVSLQDLRGSTRVRRRPDLRPATEESIEELKGRLVSRGGRPADSAPTIRRLVPLRKNVWKELQAQANVLSRLGRHVSPGQLAAILRR